MLNSVILALALVGQLPDNPFLENPDHAAMQEPEVRVTEFKGIGQEGKYAESLEILLGGVDEDGDPNIKRVYFYAHSKVIKIYHESDRETECELKDCYGRLVIFKEGEAVIIKGGVHPRVFDRAMKRAIEHPEDNNDKFLNVLVNKGMSDHSYTTREAAYNILKRKGLEALPALLAGRHSKDLEVKIRCEGLINYLRTGVQKDK